MWLCVFETGRAGHRTISSEGDKAEKMIEGSETAVESEKDVVQNCTCRYCIDVDIALLTLHPPAISLFLSEFLLPLNYFTMTITYF